MFEETVLRSFLRTIETSGNEKSFYIKEEYFSYDDLARAVSKIRGAIQKECFITGNVGLITNDDLDTYASVFAVWLEGLAYVPISPLQPYEKNLEIASQANLCCTLDSSGTFALPSIKTIHTKSLLFDIYSLEPSSVSDQTGAIVLFTSGSTGKPKGVSISRGNIQAFTDAFWNLGYEINYQDRVLQAFDLTFDLSVMSFLIPLLRGACVYTVPPVQVKYCLIADLLEKFRLTVALMVPSTIRYLQPFFKEMSLPYLRYCLFCGESLPLELTQEWSKCIPNSIIDNVYGPTEATIFCTQYRYNINGLNKSHNGVLSIGKSMKNCRLIIVDENRNEIKDGLTGELCISGGQLSSGYLNMPEKNRDVFFVDDLKERYYRTGDLCYKDPDGDIMFCGRLDTQVKVQGYRIELGEIEFHVREIVRGRNVVALCYQGIYGNNEIALFIEGNKVDRNSLMDQIRKRLSNYMIPNRIFFQEEFPLNSNGKTDKSALQKMIM